MDAERGHVFADGVGHLFDELRVEGGAPGDRSGIHRRTPCREAGQAFLVSDCWDAES